LAAKRSVPAIVLARRVSSSETAGRAFALRLRISAALITMRVSRWRIASGLQTASSCDMRRATPILQGVFRVFGIAEHAQRGLKQTGDDSGGTASLPL